MNGRERSGTLGILDWGIGGLGFFRALRERHPAVPVVYWSDAGATPYGKLPAKELGARVVAVATALRRRGVSHLVVACNAASTVLPALGVGGAQGTLVTPAGSLLVTGIISHGVRLARGRRGALTLGVVGGRRTIRAGLYRRALAAPGKTILQRVAQPLSALIEQGTLAGPALERPLARILRPLRGTDALLLACTHYPAIAGPIRALLPGTTLLDPVDALLSFVSKGWLSSRPPRAQGTPPRRARSKRAAHLADRFLTTGDPSAMRHAAAAAFGVELPAIRRVQV